jgi:ATP-dependent helicase/nuclease subunit A
MGWTEKQQKVIDTRNKNLLVSAAAGSGKTAVLVERIISMISEGKSPLDIDHLLVVTFTNAAAAEMRTRIGKAIDEKLLLEPGNLHLQKQISLLQSAQITTIHSFCLNIIRNYFHRIDLDPSFKIAEESEITLMKSDVIADLLEHWYEEGREDFHSFIESYSYSKSDAPIEELILQLYHFSMSDPWPKVWLMDKKKYFDVNSLDEMYATEWMKEIKQYIEVVISDLFDKNTQTINICEEAGGPTAYLPALISDRELLESLKHRSSYGDYYNLFSGISFARLSGKKEEGVSQDKKDRVKELREEIKKGLKDIASQYFFQQPMEMLKDLQSVRDIIHILFDLTLDFMERFAKRKEEKNLIDFHDLEHFALKILVEEKAGEMVPSQAATELSELFDEILIDEYQDSNMVQETILKSISREAAGRPNRFMVGDVKQSIYKFRLAMPEIFMEKYARYSLREVTETGEINLEQRIDLDKNFRSRKVVLDNVNDIFGQIMKEAVGGIQYDTAASLKYGELFEEINETLTPEIQERISSDVELLLVTEEEADTQLNQMYSEGDSERSTEFDHAENPEKLTEENPEEAVYTKKEIEARAIARRIRELVHPKTGLMLFDNKKKLHRPAEYRDIVILLRSMSNWSEIFVNTLMQEGIPAYAQTGTGYFQTLEIMTVLNLLRIIDNPRQDIPLTGVLYSPIVGLTTTELAMVRAFNRKVSMYTAITSYTKDGDNEELKNKLDHFRHLLEAYRNKAKHAPIHELLQELLDQSGYYYYVSAMPGGDRRKANIDMLISQAVHFEKSSYSGLFNFIRYIEKLHKYEVDFGEASTSGEQDNTVRIMSIHKSKGLEFPVVFVAGMSKQFNNQDIRSSIVLHATLGVGPEYIDDKLRTRIPTLLKKVIQKKVQIENMGEELRVLYVAMTRAREKLIMTGYLKSMEELKKKEFSFFELSSAKSYLEWILPAIINQIGMDLVREVYGFSLKHNSLSLKILQKEILLLEEFQKQVFIKQDEEELWAIKPEVVYDQELREAMKERFDFTYPYLKEAGLRVKMTVSELKKLGQFVDEEQSENLYQLPELNYEKQEGPSYSGELNIHPEILEFNPSVPAFIRQEAVLTGTDRGTLYHKALELLDLTKTYNKEDLKREFSRMVSGNQLRESDIALIKMDYFIKFVESDVANRMRKAQTARKLYKEKQFVIGIKASEVMKELDSDELILIQGIVDVFFEEDGELVLLDYKSDRINSEEALIKRYQVQLEYYRKALEQIIGKKVKEMILYSLFLGKEIRIV